LLKLKADEVLAKDRSAMAALLVFATIRSANLPPHLFETRVVVDNQKAVRKSKKLFMAILSLAIQRESQQN
jgi:hypothetical protein